MRDGPDRLPRDRYIATSELLGEGGMAKVWRVWHRPRGLWCAVKILREKFVEQPAARRRFINESRTLIRLDHKNVIAGWEVGEGEHPYLTMEIADGGTLKEWVIRHGAMPPRMAVGVAFQVCKGLNAAHTLGVIHRDVKPHNILVNRKGMCKVSDFGIARIPRDDGGEDVPDATTAQATDAMGTMGYMAPEQRSDPHRVDPRTDVYGVGATLFDLLTGHPLHNLFMADREPDMLIEVPDVLRPILIKAVKYRPEDRYPSVLDLAKDLHAVRAQLPPDPSDTVELAAGLLPEPAPPPGVERAPDDSQTPDLDRLFSTIPRSLGSVPPPPPPSPRAVAPPMSSPPPPPSRYSQPPRAASIPPELSQTPSTEAIYHHEPPPPPPPRRGSQEGRTSLPPRPAPGIRSAVVDTPASRSSTPDRRSSGSKPRRINVARVSYDDGQAPIGERTRPVVVITTLALIWIFMCGIFDAAYVRWAYVIPAQQANERFVNDWRSKSKLHARLRELGVDTTDLDTQMNDRTTGPEAIARGRPYLDALHTAVERAYPASVQGNSNADRDRSEVGQLEARWAEAARTHEAWYRGSHWWGHQLIAWVTSQSAPPIPRPPST